MLPLAVSANTFTFDSILSSDLRRFFVSLVSKNATGIPRHGGAGRYLQPLATFADDEMIFAQRPSSHYHFRFSILCSGFSQRGEELASAISVY